MPVPTEFRLAAACCRWPPSPARDEAVRAAAAAEIDWSRFEAVVARHRIEGLVHDGLARAGIAPPPPLAEALRKAATSIAAENLRYAAEAARLSVRLHEAGVAHLFLKGLVLNALAYGTLAVKRSADLDVAVEPGDAPSAAAAMAAAGFRRAPSPDEAKDELWLKDGLAVELHRALVDSPLMLPSLSVRAPGRTVEVAPGISLPTLRSEEMFAYLAVHGATHAWSRLKWLADLAALLNDCGPDDIAALHRRAVELGAGRAPAQALLLCADLLALDLGPLERELRADRIARWLERVALRAMLRGGGSTELDSLTFGTAAIHLSHLALMPGWRFKRAELRRKLASHGGHPLLAPPRWVWRRFRAA